jgi:hypothetical protein
MGFKKLKLASIILLLIIVPLSIKAQGNLQFSKVVTIANSAGCGVSFSSPIFQVPQGKIWKVEKYAVNFSYQDAVTKNTVLIKGTSEISPGDFNSGNPIWLNSGDSMQVLITAGGYFCATYFFSIIEYNLIP